MAVSVASVPRPQIELGPAVPTSIIDQNPKPGKYITTFQIQNKSGDPSPDLLYPASSNTVWVVTVPTGSTRLSQIVNFTLQNSGTWTANPIVSWANTSINDIVYDHATNLAWVIENDSLAYYNQATKRIVVAQTFPNASPLYFAIDSQDHFWITLFFADQIVEYSPGSGRYNITSTPTSQAGVYGITASPTDGNIWFAEASVGKIGRLTPCNSSGCPVTEYSPPPPLDLRGMVQVVVDNKGVVWFAIHSGNEFGSFNPSTGDWKLFPTGYCPPSIVVDCSISLPNAISTDLHGQIWFSEHYAGKIGRFNPNTSQLIEYSIPTTSKVCERTCPPFNWWMWPGPNNLVWFVAWGLGEIGYVNASVPVQANISAPNSITITQGSSANFPVSATYSDNPPSLNVSAIYLDTSPEPPMLSWSIEPAQLSTIEPTVSSTVTLSAAWSSKLGSRYIVISAYNQNLTVNSFVRVGVAASLTSYATIALAGSLSAFTVASVGPSWYARRKRDAIAVRAVASK